MMETFLIIALGITAPIAIVAVAVVIVFLYSISKNGLF